MAIISLELISSYLLFAAKWGLILIIAANWEAIPFVWHLRVFWTCGIWLAKRLPLHFFPYAKREYLYKRMPIGENPFDFTFTYDTSVGLADSDYNIHLSNSSYGKNFDYARMQAFVYWFPSLILNGTRLGLGASHYHFIKEIPVGARYQIRVNIVAWEEKWIHLVAQFVTYPKKKRGQEKGAGGQKSEAIAPLTASPSATSSGASTPFGTRANSSVRLRVNKSPLGESSRFESGTPLSPPESSPASDTEGDDLFDVTSARSTPATSAGSTSPHMKSDLSIGDAGLAAASNTLAAQVQSTSGIDLGALPALPEGAVLHCVHVSSYCFKQGRITVPPRVALVAAGFGDPAVGRATRVKQITDTLSRSSAYRTVGEPAPEPTHTIPELMRSEWKRYEPEGLWDLPEYEERNRAGVDRYRPLRLALDSLRF